MASTYEPIASTTLGSNSNSVTLSSIPQTFTDLIAVWDFALSGASNNVRLRMGNSSVDTGNNYSGTYVWGDGSSAASSRRSNIPSFYLANAGNLGTGRVVIVSSIMSYANTNVYKTVLAQCASPGVLVSRDVGLWRSTSAIDVIEFISAGYDFVSGSTFSLFGVKAA